MVNGNFVFCIHNNCWRIFCFGKWLLCGVSANSACKYESLCWLKVESVNLNSLLLWWFGFAMRFCHVVHFYGMCLRAKKELKCRCTQRNQDKIEVFYNTKTWPYIMYFKNSSLHIKYVPCLHCTMHFGSAVQKGSIVQI